MNSLAASWASAALLLAGVASYWAYTLGGVRLLAPWLGTFRRVVMIGSVATLPPLLAHAGVDGLLPASVGLVAFLYALGRQWLLMDSAPVLVPGEDDLLAPTDLAVVLPDGSGVPLALLARLRTARIGDDTLVFCGLARALTLFVSAGDLRPELPRATGFSVAGPAGVWDGVDGASVLGGEALRRSALTLADGETWRSSHPDAVLYVLEGQRKAIPPTVPTPRVPGSRAVADPMRLGAVRDGRWSSSTEEPADLFLARWAARTRGLQGTEDSP